VYIYVCIYVMSINSHVESLRHHLRSLSLSRLLITHTRTRTRTLQ
jgi:hypothetical protein